MPFKFFYFSLFFIFLLTSCSKKTIPRHQSVVAEAPALEQIDSDLVKKSSSIYNDTHKALEKKIQSGKSKKLLFALKEIEKNIFSPESLDAKVYTSDNYLGFMRLYSQVFQAWKDELGDSVFSRALVSSLQTYKKRFIDPCALGTDESCELVRKVLKRESRSVAIIIYFAKNESDTRARLTLLKMAYDVTHRRKNLELEQLYLNTVIDELSASSPTGALKQEIPILSDIYNVVNIIQQMDWDEITPQRISIFLRLKVWEVDTPREKALYLLRKPLFSFLPLYMNADAQVKKGMNGFVKKTLNKMTQEGEQLKQIPAYQSSDLNSILNEEMPILFAALSIYNGGMSEKQASAYISRLSDNSQALDKMYTVVKILIKWSVAQLSIASTKSLKTDFLSQAVKSEDFVRRVLENSEKLTPKWNNFYSTQVDKFHRFFKMNRSHFSSSKNANISGFFTSIRRNVLKTVVYPNMLAFIHYMAKTEAKRTVQAYWFSFEFDSATIYEELVTGQIKVPWFNFTGLSNVRGEVEDNQSDLSDEDRDSENSYESLSRSEIIDAVYYMVATHTHRQYQIKVDDFISTMGSKLMSQHKPYFDFSMRMHQENYLNPASGPQRLLSWCEKIKKDLPTKETHHFYDLHKFLTPHTKHLRLKLHEGSRDIILFHKHAYFSNQFSGVETREVMDRYRTEFVPAFHFYNEVLSMTERFNQKKSKNVLSLLNSSLNLKKRLEYFQKSFLGTHFLISEKMSDCYFTASEESRRRSRELAQREYQYYSKIVYPLLTAVTDKKITLEKVNMFLTALHDDGRAYRDTITWGEDDSLYFGVSYIGFMYRVQKFLREGLVAEHPLLGEIVIEPVIGRDFKVDIPFATLYTDKRNPFVNAETKTSRVQVTRYTPKISMTDFSSNALSLVTDGLLESDTEMLKKFSLWGSSESQVFLEAGLERLEFEVQLVQLGEFEYFDVLRPECRNYLQAETLDKSCMKVQHTQISDVASLMGKLFHSIHIDEKTKDYFEKAKLKNYLSNVNMDLQLRFDEPRGGRLAFDKVSGFLDYAYELFSEDYLGNMFNSRSRQKRDEVNVDKQDMAGLDTGLCENYRNNCPWVSEKDLAEDFYVSRFEKPAPIFGFDKDILLRGYAYNRDQVMVKLGHLDELEKEGARLLSEHWHEEAGHILVDLDRGPMTMYSLSRNKNVYQQNYNRFFKEKTSGFYLNMPNWGDYLKHTQ